MWYAAYKSSPVVGAAPISGSGDQAFADGYASLSILTTDTYVRIAVSPAGAPPSLADEQRLATAILAGLWSVCAIARSRALAARSHRTVAGAHNPAQGRATGIPAPAFP